MELTPAGAAGLRLGRERRVAVLGAPGVARALAGAHPGLAVEDAPPGVPPPGADAYVIPLAGGPGLDAALDRIAAVMGPEALLVALVPPAGAARAGELAARVLRGRGFRVTGVEAGRHPGAPDVVRAVVPREPCGA